MSRGSILLYGVLPYVALAIFVVAAVITPSSDMASQAIVAFPMIGLYIISIGIAWIFGKKKVESEEL